SKVLKNALVRVCGSCLCLFHKSSRHTHTHTHTQTYIHGLESVTKKVLREEKGSSSLKQDPYLAHTQGLSSGLRPRKETAKLFLSPPTTTTTTTITTTSIITTTSTTTI
ncbi:hypothetical protein V1478_013366, partial [Vespula squamosa]